MTKMIEYVDDVFIDIINKDYDATILKAISINIPKDYILVDTNRSFITKGNKKNKLLMDITLPPTKWKIKKVKFLDKPIVSFVNSNKQ